MRQVYSPANAVEAHMLAHLLDQEGIEAHIHGEALQSGVGELPAGNLLQLLVPDEDHERARKLLLAWEKTNVPGDDTPIRNRPFPFVTALAFLFVGAFSGWVLKLGIDSRQISIGEGKTEIDLNGDGVYESAYYYPGGGEYPSRFEADYNFDGRVDRVDHFDEVGILISSESDVDFNGTLETRSSFESGVAARSESDTDDNGAQDYVVEFENGVLVREEILDSRVGRIARVNHFENQVIVRSEFDEDRDGFLETVRTYDRFGVVLSTEVRDQPR
jgi:hypothetical protein